jgi:hypothetical protein
MAPLGRSINCQASIDGVFTLAPIDRYLQLPELGQYCYEEFSNHINQISDVFLGAGNTLLFFTKLFDFQKYTHGSEQATVLLRYLIALNTVF